MSYLCIYFAGWMNQNVSEIGKEDAPYKILLVVSDGNSTSSLIQLQLVNLLKPLHFSYDVVSSRQFMSSMAEKYALVVGDIERKYLFACYSGFCDINRITEKPDFTMEHKILQYE